MRWTRCKLLYSPNKKNSKKEENYQSSLQYAPEMIYSKENAEKAKGSQIKKNILVRAKEIEQSSKSKNDKVMALFRAI